MLELLQHVVNGVSLGSMYALVALGYTMVYGVLDFINFAHGDVFMLGAFFGYYLARWLGLGRSPSVAGALGVLLLAMAACAAVGFVNERLAYRPLRGRSRLSVLITAIGVSLFLENGAQLLFGADPKLFPTLIPSRPLFESDSIYISTLQVLSFGIALGLMAALNFLVFKTRFGRALRAVSYSPRTAALMGINVDRVISLTFVIGSALAGAAGILVGQTYPRLDPLMGVLFGLKAFVAAVLGGIGNIVGAVVGGLVMGLAEALVSGYGLSSYRDAVAFAILIGILLFRPSGLLGRAVAEKV